MSPTSPILTCQCCQTIIKSTLQPKKLLLNNVPFCNHCKEQYRSCWLLIVLSCVEKIKVIYQEMSKNVMTLANIANSYAIILRKEIQKQLQLSSKSGCQSGIKFQDNQKFCNLYKKKFSKCKWCVFKKMVPLVMKISIFRYKKVDDCYDSLRHFYNYNEEICKRVWGYFRGGNNLEHKKDLEENMDNLAIKQKPEGAKTQKSKSPESTSRTPDSTEWSWIDVRLDAQVPR